MPVHLLQVSAATYAILFPSLTCFGAAAACLDLLSPQTFQQRSDSNLGSLHFTPATAMCNPYFSLLSKILNYQQQGEQLHQTAGGQCSRTVRILGAYSKCRILGAYSHDQTRWVRICYLTLRVSDRA